MKLKSIAVVLLAGLFSTSSAYAYVTKNSSFEIKCNTGGGYPVDYSFVGSNGNVVVTTHNSTIDHTNKYRAVVTHLLEGDTIDLRFNRMDSPLSNPQHLRLRKYSSNYEGALYTIDVDNLKGASVSARNSFETCTASFS
ncbi:hypothetical protein [Vibrio sp. dhg]|uniref:hypothetical protein n=1 Tax=Vibrio sp. dhg TaxID=2163016 RepID=UPI000E47F3F8|nr:hypothetical protein [Vibrio sp. dhg]AXT74236.1 hypothetical protein DBX26_25020 [Vibrio sp. dhg]